MDHSVQQSRKAIGLYLLFTFSLSSIFYYLIIHTGKLGSGFGLYVVALMWCPALSCFITTKLMKRNISGLAWQWGNPKYQLWSFLTPIAYGLVAYLVIWLAGWGIFYNYGFVDSVAKSFGFVGFPSWLIILLYFIFSAVGGITTQAVAGLGEELGWRGFLVPELYKISGYTKTSLLVGLIWSVWHFPILIFADYNNGAPVWYGLTCFTVMVTSMSFVFAWFRLKSKSIWTSAWLHGSHNLFIQTFFTPLTTYTRQTKYFIDEFGAVLPVICLIAAIYFWTRRHELEKEPA